MTQAKTLKYNKRCAEFLGWEQTSNGSYICPERYCNLDYESYYRGIASDLKFHSDWNWIMEVIEAIEKLKYLIVIQSNFCQIQEIGERENNFKPYIISSFYSNSKKEAVISAIDKFLNWYNERKISNI